MLVFNLCREDKSGFTLLGCNMFFWEVVYKERLMKFRELRGRQYKLQSCGYFC